MKENRFYITGNLAGCNQTEAINKLSHIEYNLKIAGVKPENIFNSATIDIDLPYDQEMNIRMAEIAKADVIVFESVTHECVESQLEFKEAVRLKKHIRVDRQGDYDDIRKNLIWE
jgi:hypothetical protein